MSQSDADLIKDIFCPVPVEFETDDADQDDFEYFEIESDDIVETVVETEEFKIEKIRKKQI